MIIRPCLEIKTVFTERCLRQRKTCRNNSSPLWIHRETELNVNGSFKSFLFSVVRNFIVVALSHLRETVSSSLRRCRLTDYMYMHAFGRQNDTPSAKIMIAMWQFYVVDWTAHCSNLRRCSGGSRAEKHKGIFPPMYIFFQIMTTWKTRKTWRLRCASTWGRPMPRQSLSHLITTPMPSLESLKCSVL